jgi:hypothetical protein
LPAIRDPDNGIVLRHFDWVVSFVSDFKQLSYARAWYSERSHHIPISSSLVGAFISNDGLLHVKRGCIRSNLLTNIRLLLASDPAGAVVAEVSGAPQAETSVPLAIGSEAIGIVVD